MEWEHSIPTAPEWAANEIARLKTELALARLERDNIASLNSSLIAELAVIRHLPIHLGGGRSRGRPPPLSVAWRIEMEPDKWVRLRDGRGGSLGLQYEAYYEIDRLSAELAATKEALKPFADLRVTRFMTDGLRYDFRVDAAWIRKARTVGGMEE